MPCATRKGSNRQALRERGMQRGTGVKLAVPQGTLSGSQCKPRPGRVAKNVMCNAEGVNSAGPARSRSSARKLSNKQFSTEPRAGLSAKRQPGRIPNNAMRNAAGVKYADSARTRTATRKGSDMQSPNQCRVDPSATHQAGMVTKNATCTAGAVK